MRFVQNKRNCPVGIRILSYPKIHEFLDVEEGVSIVTP
jgi:hypothetical protein